jgi:hypothetical protein
MAQHAARLTQSLAASVPIAIFSAAAVALPLLQR